MSLNAQSINNKFQKIRDATHKIAPVALCIQETWGKNKTTDYYNSQDGVTTSTKMSIEAPPTKRC